MTSKNETKKRKGNILSRQTWNLVPLKRDASRKHKQDENVMAVKSPTSETKVSAKRNKSEIYTLDERKKKAKTDAGDARICTDKSR